MKKHPVTVILSLFYVLTLATAPAQTLRPPAYPLITHDPYFSVWSTTDKLTDSPTCHWTGKPQSLEGLVRVDGKAYQFLGAETIKYQTVLPTGESVPYTAQYTLTTPGAGWEQPDYTATGWKTAPGPFGDTPAARTQWRNVQTNKDGIYVRREFTYDSKTDPAKLMLSLNHDDAVTIYLNGVLILEKSGYVSEYIALPLSAAGQKALRTGRNVLAMHCISPTGGSFIDVGLVSPVAPSCSVTTATQTGVTVAATQTDYTFTAGPVNLRVNFLSPLLLDELEVVARPVSYVTVEVDSRDGNTHAVQLFFGESGMLAANTGGQDVVANAGRTAGVRWLNVGTRQQPVLEKKGDNSRIDWGYAYLAVPSQIGAQLMPGPLAELKRAFLTQGTLSAGAPADSGKSAGGTAQGYGLALSMPFGTVGTTPVQKHFMLAYDDLYSVQYFGQNLRAWWRRDEKMTMPALLQTAENDYARLRQKSTAFDAELRADAQKSGGSQYADLCVLAYRQAIAAHKIVASGPSSRSKGEVLFLSKENFSNGSIGTVDITYLSAPMFLLYNNELAKGLLRFIFDYSESGRWTKDFPAHDIGTYPLANGQTYGEDMPVEEAGNMMILTAAAVQQDGKPDFARQHWPTLTKWVDFLKHKEGGHIDGSESRTSAGAGPHYALTFAKTPGSWSQKYNIVWDKLLNLNVFPKEVAKEEIKFYLTKQQLYGLPLDSRKTYTKSDWIMWTATMADSDADFKAFIGPIWKYANETPGRVPLSDWHETTNARQVGFQARSVVGGYYIKMLSDKLNLTRTNQSGK